MSCGRLAWQLESPSADGDVAVSAVGLRKSFGPTEALRGVSVEARYGDITGFVGENGAGKSTLLRLLGGALLPDGGDLFLRGRPVRFRSPYDANLAGIFSTYQDVTVIPEMTVYENVFLGFHGCFGRLGVLDHLAMRRAAAPHIEAVLGTREPLMWPAGRLTHAACQLLQVARALACADLLGTRRPILLLDELTATLHDDDIRRLFSLLLNMKSRAAILLVSHRLPEVLELSDRLVVMRDGSIVEKVPSAQTVSESSLHSLMVGRERNADYYLEHAQAPAGQAIVMSVDQLSATPWFEDVTFDIRQGEIVGIAGVEGSGKEEVGRCLFGVVPHGTGSVVIQGRRVEPRSPHQMKRFGVGLLPVDRAAESLVVDLPVTANVTLAGLSRFVRRFLGIIDFPRELTVTRDFVQRLRIKLRSASSLVRELSGGNQQKVALAKWMLLTQPVLIAENPTQGLDVGAKQDVYGILRELSSKGCAVLIISDDLVELIGLCHRLLVMRDGRVSGELECRPDAKPNETDVVRLMV